MKFSIVSSLIIFLVGIIVSTIIFAQSPFYSGNRADTIELLVRILFYGVLLLISLLSYLVLDYFFRLPEIFTFFINNILIIICLLIMEEPRKNPQLLIYYPVFLILSFLFQLYKKYRSKALTH